MGAGPRLWLGCCGVYFQPSEPLKLLLVIYLSAYLADRIGIGLLSSRNTLFFPTLVVTSLALLLLLVQRDLGTASIFICIFTIIIFIVTGKRRVLISAILFIITCAGGRDITSLMSSTIRVDGWLNPWNDPSGKFISNRTVASCSCKWRHHRTRPRAWESAFGTGGDFGFYLRGHSGRNGSGRELLVCLPSFG